MLDLLSDDQLRNIKEAVTVLVDAQFSQVPEVQKLSNSLRELLRKVDVYLNQPSLEADAEIERDVANHRCSFYFLDAEKVRVDGGEFSKVPEFSQLQTGGWLSRNAIDIDKAHLGCYVEDVLSVSHSWESKPHPDTTGEQWTIIRKFLDSDPGLKFKWVWVDFPCMPQGSRTPYQRSTFRWMLKNVNKLFLGGSVLIIMDSAYMSKFWTQFEAWLAMQRCTAQGLAPAVNKARWFPRCIHSATSVAELELRWSNKTPDEAVALLSKPDCIVTNMSDKATQLSKLATLDVDVQSSWLPNTIARLCHEAWRDDSFKLDGFGFSKEQVSNWVSWQVTELWEARGGGDIGEKLLRAGYCREELAQFGIFMGPDASECSRLWCPQTLEGHTDSVTCLTQNGTSLFSASDDGTIKVWDLDSSEYRLSLTGHTGWIMCMVLNHRSLFSGSYDMTIKVESTCMTIGPNALLLNIQWLSSRECL